MRKVTQSEFAAYAASKPVYPIRYIAYVPYVRTENGFRERGHDRKQLPKLPVFIERTNDPMYEIVAPPGYMFVNHETHTILEHTLADVRDQLKYEELTNCWSEGCCDRDEMDHDKFVETQNALSVFLLNGTRWFAR